MEWTPMKHNLMTLSFWVVSKGNSWSTDSTINKTTKSFMAMHYDSVLLLNCKKVNFISIQLKTHYF